MTEVTMSKMDHAKILFAQLKSGEKPAAEGKTARATFIAEAQLPPISLSASGASTYWQNLVTKDKAAAGEAPVAAKPEKAAKAEKATKAEKAAEAEKAEPTPPKVVEVEFDESDLSHLQ